MRKLFLIAVTTVGFTAPMLPAFAADAVQPVQTAAAAPSLSQTLMQAELDKCLAAGTITMAQVQAMTDDQLVKALDDCSKVATAAAAPQVITQPTFVPQPVVVSQPVSDFVPAPRRVFADNSFGGSGGGVFNGSAIDVGGIGNTTTTTTSTQNNNFPDLPGNGADAGNGNPPANKLDARIAGLQSGLQQGITNGNLTGPEAARLGAEIANLQTLRSNLGDGALARLRVQRAIDRTTADFNTSVHNNQGIPDPDLFRSLKRKNGAPTLAGNDPHSRFAALRERMASLKNGGALSKTPGNTGIAGGILSKRQGNTGIAGGLFPRKVPGNTGIAGGLVSKASSTTDSIHSKFVQRRIEAAKVTRQVPVFTKSAKSFTPHVWAQNRATSKGSAGAPRFNRRKFASR